MIGNGLFTFCPSCLKQFRVQATELSFASGVVCCGVCGEQFNALLRLSDVPLSHAQQESLSQSYDLQVDSVHAAPAPTGSVHADPALVNPVLVNPVALTPPLLASHSVDSSRDNLEMELMERLRVAQSSSRHWFATVAWAGGVSLLVFLLFAQLFWFNRDFMVQRYPQSLFVFKAICQQFDCDVLRYKELAAIHLLQRNVSYHLSYPDRLNIRAKIVNNSASAQAFPSVSLALFDTLGRVIAHGEFMPEDYVRGAVDIDFGMQPKASADFRLSLYDAPVGATSFEFLFL